MSLRFLPAKPDHPLARSDPEWTAPLGQEHSPQVRALWDEQQPLDVVAFCRPLGLGFKRHMPLTVTDVGPGSHGEELEVQPHMKLELIDGFKGTGVNIIVVPSDIQASMYHQVWCRVPLGFESSMAAQAELAGNLAVDCRSSKKYWHFIRAGDTNLTMEMALQI